MVEEWHRLDSRNPGDWLLVPEVIRRLQLFILEEYGRIPRDFVKNFIAHFAAWAVQADQVRMAVWVGLEGGRVVAHTLVEVSTWHGETVLSVEQHASDKGHPYTREACLGIDREMVEWGRALGVTEMRTVARSPVLARVYRSLYGWREVVGRTFMRRDLICR